MHLPEIEVAGNALRISIGEGRVGGVNDSYRATLGSCVGLCVVWSNQSKFVLAHVLLPHESSAAIPRKCRARYADTVVPWAIEQLEVPSCSIRELVAYVAGGARMFADSQQTHVGDDNQQALIDSLRQHRVRVKGSDFGGEEGRQLVVDGPSRRVFSLGLERDLVTRWEFPRSFGAAA